MITFTITGKGFRPFETGGAVSQQDPPKPPKKSAAPSKNWVASALQQRRWASAALGHRFYDPIYKEAQDLGLRWRHGAQWRL
jgi:hypothetical protein